TIQSQEQTMKTIIATAALSIVLGSPHTQVALAQRAPATTPLVPEAAPVAGAVPPALNELAYPPSTGGGGFGGPGVGVIDIPRVAGGRYSANGSGFSYHASPAGSPTTVHFFQPDSHSEDALQDDLNVMSNWLQN